MARHILIVGSGVAGSMLAKHLLEKNPDDRVTMLEAGTAVPMRDRRKWMDFVTTGALPYASRYDAPEDFIAPANSLGIVRSRIFARGGTTLHWTGHTPRYKPEDFALKTNGGHEIDWPFTYEQFAPYYVWAENALTVSGNSADNDPPRYGVQFPIPAPPFCAADGPVIDALESLNMRYSNLPSARSGRCITTGTCPYCPVGGRYTGDMTLDELARNPRFTLTMGVVAAKVHMNGKKRASGVTMRETATGKTTIINADLIILSAGAVETPKLLMASADAQWSKGVGNDTGHLGRNFKNHVQVRAEGVIPTNPKKLQQEIDIGTLQSRHFDNPQEQSEGKFQFTRPAGHPNVGLEARMKAGEGASVIEDALDGPMQTVLLGYVEPFSVPENEILLAPGTNRFGLPRTEFRYAENEVTLKAHQKALGRMQSVLERTGAKDIKLSSTRPSNAAHLGSTCRMAKNPKDGVVDENLRVHGTDNLYVVSNAVLPNIAAVNPTLTLVGLAIRLSEHLSPVPPEPVVRPGEAG